MRPANSQVPVERKLSSLRGAMRDGVDLFICSASFEKRCLSIPEHLPLTRIERVLICENQNLHAYVHHNAVKLQEHFGKKAQIVPTSTDDPLVTADGMLKELLTVSDGKGRLIVVDITTFTHEGLLILLKLLQRIGIRNRVRLLYSGARSYMKVEKGHEPWLSKGIASIRSVLGYPGAMADSDGVHLIVQVGFEYERARGLVERYEPNVVSLGFGAKEESISPAHHEDNMKFFDQLVDVLGNVNKFAFSCRDPVMTAGAIRKQAALFPRHAPVVASLNTKVATVGAALAAFQDPRIQLCYAQAQLYNYKGYSTPSDTYYEVAFPVVPSTK